MLDARLAFRLGGLGGGGILASCAALNGGSVDFGMADMSESRFSIAIGFEARAVGFGREVLSPLTERLCVPFGRLGSWWRGGDRASVVGAGWACDGELGGGRSCMPLLKACGRGGGGPCPKFSDSRRCTCVCQFCS